jgi:hypothetical protein
LQASQRGGHGYHMRVKATATDLALPILNFKYQTVGLQVCSCM